MVPFTYYHFPMLQLSALQSEFQGRYEDWLIVEGYRHWLDSYSRRARTFYLSQRDRHFDLTYRYFCSNYSLDYRISLDERSRDWSSEWEEYCQEHGFQEHCDRLEVALDQARDYLEVHDPARVAMDDAVHISENAVGWLTYSGVHATDILPQIWSLWFDFVTADEPELGRMSYEVYLETPHWKLVRAAMLLAHGLRCQGDPCICSDSYFGWEHKLHVHHLTYQNRGHEKLADLRLLCEDCHRLVHEGVKTIVDDYYIDEF